MDIYKGKRSDEWGTPQSVFDAMGPLPTSTWDVCASAANYKFAQYWDKETDALKQDWRANGAPLYWMNPPFSRAKEFFSKAAEEAAKGVSIIAIYKASNLETDTWQKMILPHARSIFVFNRRTEYVMPDGTQGRGVPFGSALIFYGSNYDALLRGRYGTLIRLK